MMKKIGLFLLVVFIYVFFSGNAKEAAGFDNIILKSDMAKFYVETIFLVIVGVSLNYLGGKIKM